MPPRPEGCLSACNPPEPGTGRTIRTVTPRRAPDRDKALLQDILDSGSGQGAAEARGQPGGVPHEELAQRGIVAGSARHQQLLVA